MTWGTVPRASLTLVRGELRVVPHAGRLRSFAACCGTPLFFEEAKEAETVDFTVCSLDDPAPWAPKKAIWTEDRLPWVAVKEGMPVFGQSSGGSV